MGRVGTRGAHAQVGSRLSWSFSARASYGPRPPRAVTGQVPVSAARASAGVLRSALRTAGRAARYAARHRPGRRRRHG
ncbi:hypothetical protein ABZW47_05445 [Streptomyces sp. NPDC004549]|uniref:hypothetical protein n=1 Tax=Streptomyces sp. NPDC004549 TaxID=3154283 RepID=UPI0033B7C6E0